MPAENPQFPMLRKAGDKNDRVYALIAWVVMCFGGLLYAYATYPPRAYGLMGAGLVVFTGGVVWFLLTTTLNFAANKAEKKYPVGIHELPPGKRQDEPWRKQTRVAYIEELKEQLKQYEEGGLVEFYLMREQVRRRQASDGAFAFFEWWAAETALKHLSKYEKLEPAAERLKQKIERIYSGDAAEGIAEIKGEIWKLERERLLSTTTAERIRTIDAELAKLNRDLAELEAHVASVASAAASQTSKPPDDADYDEWVRQTAAELGIPWNTPSRSGAQEAKKSTGA